MNLNFDIHENYLIVHTISSMDKSQFSSQKDKKDIISLQNFAWRKSQACYNLLVGRLTPVDLEEKRIQVIAEDVPRFFQDIKKNQKYKKILIETQKYLRLCQQQWKKNQKRSTQIIQDLTGLNLDKTFTVYLTHPSLKNGLYLSDNKIVWGHNEDWPNYSTVYLWHEILHSYFGTSALEHALIQLITDEELRVRLNGGKYPPFVGHENLYQLMKKILPYWREYLKTENRNILKFHEKIKNSLNQDKYVFGNTSTD